ncbi:MAG: hypothetical protein ABR538_05315, partial [Candidatus Binatia bacterium]
MSVMPAPTRVAVLALLLALGVSCAPPAVQNCHRYDAVSLHAGNGFAARFDWNDERTVDLPMERVEVALTVVRPVKGPVELVHLVGDTEADRWQLRLPEQNQSLTTVCSVAPPGGWPTCGVSLANVPFSPGGYYFLRAGDNTVLEAG